jgi:hypothetical protein
MKRNKIYSRAEPSKEGKLYFIFCEGEKKETTYFHFFNQLASQIIIQIVPVDGGKNSPMGLFNTACQKLVKTQQNPTPTYELGPDDEVWFIIDTDKWGKEVANLREAATGSNWSVAQSNPCFEVWLYYHFEVEKPKEEIENWKKFLGEKVKGGFDPRKHPVHMPIAIENSKANFFIENDQPGIMATEVHLLASKILPLVKEELAAILKSYGKE